MQLSVHWGALGTRVSDNMQSLRHACADLVLTGCWCAPLEVCVACTESGVCLLTMLAACGSQCTSP